MVGRCYVCLNNTRSISPCYCQIPVHPKCLQRTRRKIDDKHCSVCHGEFSDVSAFGNLHHLKIVVGYCVFLYLWLYIFPKQSTTHIISS